MSNVSKINGFLITAQSASFAATASTVLGSISSASYSDTAVSASYATFAATASYLATPSFIDNLVTVGLPGSNVNYNSIKTAVDSITDATAINTYTVRVSPGVYIESEMVVPSYVAVKGDSSISTIVSASNPSASIFVMSDQSMVIDMQIQGSTGPSASAIVYSSPTTPQTNAIAYVENVRFGTNYTNAKVIGTGSSGNCILQCSNVKYGGFTEGNKSFDVGFHVTRTGSAGIGRMQLRNVTSTNGGVAGTDNNQVFALSDAPSCAFIVNGCLLTRAAGSALGTGFKVYNGGNLRLTGVNFQRWDKGIWAPQTGSGPSIDAIALNFENCTTDVLIEHTGSTGKVQGTDNFLKTQISLSSSLYEVGQDPRRITVGTKGADFASISASVAYITDSSDSNRYVIEVGPGRYTEKEIDLTGKPYVSIVGSSIQTTQIFPSSSNQHLIKMGINNEISFLSLTNSPAGYSALYVDDVGDYAQAHKVSFYDCDTCLTVISRTQDTKFYGEYLDFNGVYSTGSFVSSSNGYQALASLENYYQFPVGATGLIANYGTGGVAELDLYAAGLIGESDPTSVAIRLENGADLQGLGMDMPGWGSAVYIPNLANSASFNIVGSMIHDSVNYDFEILHPSASCRFQGTADHSKINNASSNFFWTFLDETDGELDITRKLSVTFADGTHTDASTLIFEGSPMGVMSGGNITISSGLTVTTAAGYGYLHNMGTEVFQRIDWNNSNITLAANSNNYLFIDETATLSASPTQPDSAHNIILGRVVTNDTGVELIDNSPYFAAHMSNALSKFNRNALGPVFAEGSIVSEDVTPRQLDITAGLYYFGENEYDPTGGSAITFTQYYQSGSGAFGWNKSSQTLVPNNTYNSGSALIAMSASYYTKHTLYTVGKGPDEEYFLVVGQNQYASLVETEDAGLPSPPTYFSDGVAALASIYVQSGSANIVQIQDIRPTIGFRSAGVNASSVHANLLGLSSDDHPQYVLANGTRAIVGNQTITGSLLVSGSTYGIKSSTGQLLTNSIPTVDWGGLVLLDTTTNNTSVDWGNRQLKDDASDIRIDWLNNQVIDATSIQSIDWENRLLTDNTANTSVDWVNRYLQDASNISSVDWQTRQLFDSGGGSILNWDSGTFNGSITGNAATATSASFASTASFVQTARTASFVTSSNVFGPFGANSVLSSSYALTASYALNGGGGAAFPFSGSAVITGSLTVYNSGSAVVPLLKVQGGSGELFSVYDTFSGSLFSVNNQAGNPILEVTSENKIHFGKPGYQALLTTQETIVTASGQFTVYSIPTASYDGAWYEYTIRSGSNARAGQVMAIWSGSQVNYSETTTTAFGSTAGLSFGVFVVGGNFALTGSATTGGWTMKTIIRSI